VPSGYQDHYAFFYGAMEDLSGQDCADPNNDDYRTTPVVTEDTVISVSFGVCPLATTASAPTSPEPADTVKATSAPTGCDEAAWPDKDHGLVCGECKVLVNRFNSFYGSCDGYCSSIGRVCTGAWEEDGDKCTVKYAMECNRELSSSDAICECGEAGETLTTMTPALTPVPKIEITAVLEIDTSAFEMSVDMFDEQVDMLNLDSEAAAEVQRFANDVSSSVAASVSSSLGVGASIVEVTCLYRNTDATQLDLLTLDVSCGSTTSRRLKASVLRKRRLQAQSFGVEVEVLVDDAVQSATSDGGDVASQIASTEVVIESDLLPAGVTVVAAVDEIHVEVTFESRSSSGTSAPDHDQGIDSPTASSNETSRMSLDPSLATSTLKSPAGISVGVSIGIFISASCVLLGRRLPSSRREVTGTSKYQTTYNFSSEQVFDGVVVRENTTLSPGTVVGRALPGPADSTEESDVVGQPDLGAGLECPVLEVLGRTREQPVTAFGTPG